MALQRSTLLLALITAGFASQAHADANAFTVASDGGIKYSNADKSVTFQLGGRLQYDYDATRSADNGVNTRDFDVRRARIDVRGTVGDWGYKAQWNIAESDGAKGGNAEDLYVQYLGFGPKAIVTIGKQPEPIGLERVNSSNDNSSLERAAVVEFFTPARSSGIKLGGAGKQWSYGIGVFESQGNINDDVGAVAFTGRGTYAPVLNEKTVLHVGGSMTRRQAQGVVPKFSVAGVEAAFRHGPFHVQGEYFDGKQGTQGIDGWYMQAGWVLTGETRPYKGGVFQRVGSAKSAGAWEVAVRHERGDGNYGDIGLKSNQIFDGQQTSATLNWYASKNVRLGVSFMKGEAESAMGQRYSGKELRTRVQYVF